MNPSLPLIALLLAAALLLAGCNGEPSAETDADDDDRSTEHQAETQQTKEQADHTAEARAEVGNEICPSSGNPVNEQVSAVHNGWKVHFFCPNCRDSFREDPEQYAERIEELTEIDIRVPAPQSEEDEESDEQEN